MHDQPSINILYYRSAASRSTCRSSAPSSSFFLNVSNSSMHSDSSLERHDVIFFTIVFFSLHRLHRAELCSFSAKKKTYFFVWRISKISSSATDVFLALKNGLRGLSVKLKLKGFWTPFWSTIRTFPRHTCQSFVNDNGIHLKLRHKETDTIHKM